MSDRFVDITIDMDGKIELNQKGYQGKECSGDIKSILDNLGGSKKVTKKKEYYDKERVRVSH